MNALETRQRHCTFYLSWFTRLYRSSDVGWQWYQTPDGRPIMEQDAFFWQALEVIAQTMNTLLAEQRNRR